MGGITCYWQACCDVEPAHRIMATHHLLYIVYNLQASGLTEQANIKGAHVSISLKFDCLFFVLLM